MGKPWQPLSTYQIAPRSAIPAILAMLAIPTVAFWLGSMLLFYIPLAVVVIYLNRMMPLEGDLYQWAKTGFGELIGFLTAWNPIKSRCWFLLQRTKR